MTKVSSAVAYFKENIREMLMKYVRCIFIFLTPSIGMKTIGIGILDSHYDRM